MKTCSKCGKQFPATNEFFNRAKWIKSGLRPDCKACYSAAKKAAWEISGANQPNRERYRKLKAERAEGLRTCKTCGVTLALTSENFSKNAVSWDSSCRKCAATKTAKWAMDNPARAKATAYAGCAKRYAAKRNRVPPWLTSGQREQMVAIYMESKERRKAGHDVHVDHIVPLIGKLVSGLHVPWNLQIIDARVNQRKSNRWAA